VCDTAEVKETAARTRRAGEIEARRKGDKGKEGGQKARPVSARRRKPSGKVAEAKEEEEEKGGDSTPRGTPRDGKVPLVRPPLAHGHGLGGGGRGKLEDVDDVEAKFDAIRKRLAAMRGEARGGAAELPPIKARERKLERTAEAKEEAKEESPQAAQKREQKRPSPTRPQAPQDPEAKASPTVSRVRKPPKVSAAIGGMLKKADQRLKRAQA
jgi:hypothetical protein